MESAITNDFAYIEFYKELDLQYPGSKFILNVRDINDWIKSRLNHDGGSYLNIYKKGKGFSKTEDVVNHWIKIWNDHIEDVNEYFKDRPDDFLMFDIKTESHKLIEFVSRSKVIKNKSFGKYNETHKKENISINRF
jgi:hypothetical protein